MQLNQPTVTLSLEDAQALANLMASGQPFAPYVKMLQETSKNGGVYAQMAVEAEILIKLMNTVQPLRGLSFPKSA
jgi:hypothetical protein